MYHILTHHEKDNEHDLESCEVLYFSLSSCLHHILQSQGICLSYFAL